MKSALQISLVVGAIPLLLGTFNFVTGAGRIVPADQVTPNLDSMWRFYTIWFTVAFFLANWSALSLEIAGNVLRIIISVTAVGGLARLFSMTRVGIPKAPMIAGTFIEIGVLAFIPWHAAVVRRLRVLSAE